MILTSLIYRSFLLFWDLIPFKRPLALGIRALGIPVGNYHRILYFNGSFKLSLGGSSFKLLLRKGDQSSLSLFWFGLTDGWDATSIRVWTELAKQSEVILDIGANLGLYALSAKSANPISKVVAFEPGRKNLEILRGNVALNKFDIILSSLALSDSEGKADFHDLEVPTAMASLKSSALLKDHAKSTSYQVEVSTLKAYCAVKGISKIDLISLDVEMNEVEVLQGMGDLIEKYRPSFIIEVLNEEIGPGIEAFFKNLEYSYFAIDEGGLLHPRIHIQRKESMDLRGYNFLLLPSTRRLPDKFIHKG